MSWNAKIIDIFLSSPSDVHPERTLVKSVVQEWNQRRGRDCGCIFTLLTWEDSVTSELENDGQGSINSQIGDHYDVILGLMWGRFGSPTAREQSGTFEEFKRALNRKRDGGAVRISFYFKNSDIPLNQIDPDQLKKVREFKSLFQSEGGLTREFHSDNELRSQINLLLEQISKDKDLYISSEISESNPKDIHAKRTDPDGDNGPTENDQAQVGELGMLDITERMQELANEFTSAMQQWADQTNALGAAATKGSEELESLARFGQPSASEVRKIVDRVTISLEDNAKYTEEHSPEVIRLMNEITYLNESRVPLIEDFQYSDEDFFSEISALSSLAEAIDSTSTETQSLLNTIEQLPRMTKRFNDARRRVISSQAPYVAELRRSLSAIERVIELFREAASRN